MANDDIPKYFYDALLLVMADGTQRGRPEMRAEVAAKIGLTEEQISRAFPKSDQNGRLRSVFACRLGWTLTYLEASGLLNRLRRGVYAISDEGLRLAREIGKGTLRVNQEYLSTHYPGFREYRNRSRHLRETDAGAQDPAEGVRLAHSSASSEKASDESTPDEVMDAAYEALNQKLIDDVLEEVRNASPDFLEQIVVPLLERMGYGRDNPENHATQYSRDGGIDAVIFEDKLGFDRICAQTKRYAEGNPVGIGEVQAFVGALGTGDTTKGVFVTTSRFTSDALKYVRNLRGGIQLRLIDGQKLSRLMVEHDLGVESERTYTVKRLNQDFFRPEEG